MARSMNMKVFYIGLGVIAVAGGVALWLAARGGGGGPVSVAPMPVDIGSFDGYTIGSDSAPVEVVEFADFQCPACARFAILTAPDLKSRLVATGRVRWTFRDFPLPIHDKAELAHHAA
ncbi:MAG: thioredoxin domain-containing protein, partial [Gemmatimonadetes bacterium]|nr:thioredoxin domain-containing protein [Gemmatimonadota bacterium]NIT67752.1 thioredoxin domain-containing protein [Gemmatimonadota bacterium]NIV23341.1 thioredoxin domain-containing protein [Gemmatimonadota bacterium]NIW75159.1 thioredoxin domain-containing protein [Gemmatimonadota bacterium]NIY36329.1 thioredoxin domain-containing protein [Gemmatimonadota bacterium]